MGVSLLYLCGMCCVCDVCGVCGVACVYRLHRGMLFMRVCVWLFCLQVIDVVKRRPDGWFYGSVVYFSDSGGYAQPERTPSQKAKLQADNGVGV